MGGRPTNGAYPYFNLQYDGGGLIAVVGWPGQWSARFVRDAADGLRVSAGQADALQASPPERRSAAL